MNLFQIIFVPLCLLGALTTLVRLARGRMARRNGLFWFALWAAAAAFITEPGLTTTIARWLGIGRGADLVFYIAILGGVTASLYFYAKCRQLEILVTTVVRNQALSAPQHHAPPKKPA
jgi:hypothetical protein